MLCPTATGEVAITVRIIRIAIIVRQFFPSSDMPEGHNPDRTGGDVDVTIGSTGVVDIAGGVPEYLAINIIAVIEGKNIDIALRYSRDVCTPTRTFTASFLIGELCRPVARTRAFGVPTCSDTTRKSMGDIVFFMKMVGSIPDDVNP